MGKRGRRSRVGQVIRRNVDRLHGRDCAVLGGGDTLLQSTDLISQRRLVADRRGHAAHQCGNLRACLYIAENIVDKQQHVLLFHIAEVFRHGQTGQCNAHTRSGRFVHLAEHERGLAQYAGFRHLAPQIVALSRAFADTGEDGVAAVLGGDVVNQLLNEHGLADTGAAEQTDLAAFGIRRKQIDDLDTGLENLSCRVLLGKRRRSTVNGPLFRCVYITLFVDRLTEHVEHASKGRFTDRRFDRAAGGQHLIAAADALARGEHDAAHGVAADVLCDLHHARLSVRCNGKRFIYLRQAAAVKSNVHNRTCYLYHGTFAFHSNFLTFYARLPSARKRTVRVGIGRRGCGVSAALPCVPPTISVISCVMADCRARL